MNTNCLYKQPLYARNPPSFHACDPLLQVSSNFPISPRFFSVFCQKKNRLNRFLNFFSVLSINRPTLAALPQSLREVEPDSTLCNACCNKNVARLDNCEACYTFQFRVQLVSQQNFEKSCIV